MVLSEISELAQESNLVLIEQNLTRSPEEWALQNQGKEGVPVRAIAEQLACRLKASRKLPALSQTRFLYDQVALEQASSSATAAFKASLIRGSHLLDMTGGLGIDTLAFSESFSKVEYVEQSESLFALFCTNLQLLGVSGIETHHGDGVAFADQSDDEGFDWIYVDPARRYSGKRLVGLGACIPNVVDAMPLLLRKSGHVCIKTSPALELTQAFKEIATIREFKIVSVGGECKEILLMIDRDCQTAKAPVVTAVLLHESGKVRYHQSGVLQWGEKTGKAGPTQAFFYEPDPAIIKSGLTTDLAQGMGLVRVNASVDYLTGDSHLPEFPGRAFRVVEQLQWSRTKVSRYLQNARIGKANVSRRDFPMSPKQIRKQLKLAEGGEDYLFFSRDFAGKPVTIHCRKVRPHGT